MTPAEKSIGIKRLLEFITNVAPAPNMMPAVTTTEEKEVECKAGDTNLFVFKTTNESHIGEINYFKVILEKL